VRLLLRKTFEYLWADFEYIPTFGSRMDYEAYWRVRARNNFGSDPDIALESAKRDLYARLIKPGSTVLEVGCGQGSLLAFLQERVSVRGYGVDVSAEACALAREKGVDATTGDAARLEFPGPETVDYVILSEVLEHLPNAEEVLAALAARTRVAILLDIPNTGAISDRLRLLAGRFPKQWVYHAGEHLRFWTIPDFRNMARQLDLPVQGVYGLPDPMLAFGVGLSKRLPSLFARYVMYVLKPASGSR
jgi:methionine biosynthesis protein MetW